MKSMLIAQRRAGDAEVEVARDGEVGGELGVLEVRDAGGAVRRGHQPVVEIRRGAAAEVGADREVQRREHLEEHEHDADRGERSGERARRVCTAPISAPVATAISAGSRPRSASSAHHAVARPGAARNSAPKNWYSCRSRSRRMGGRLSACSLRPRARVHRSPGGQLRRIVGLQLVRGTVEDRKGTFVLETAGDFDGKQATWKRRSSRVREPAISKDCAARRSSARRRARRRRSTSTTSSR